MSEILTNFRQAVADSTNLQEKVKAGANLVALFPVGVVLAVAEVPRAD